MTELQQNLKRNLLDTLQTFSSSDEQIKYKNSVPFVHIPYELAAQWESYVDLKHHGWFLELWSDQDLKNLDEFNIKLTSGLKRIGDDLDDVPEILKNAIWIEIMDTAGQVLKKLRRIDG